MFIGAHTIISYYWMLLMFCHYQAKSRPLFQIFFIFFLHFRCERFFIRETESCLCSEEQYIKSMQGSFESFSVCWLNPYDFVILFAWKFKKKILNIIRGELTFIMNRILLWKKDDHDLVFFFFLEWNVFSVGPS